MKRFYERHQYPPPRSSLDAERERWSDTGRRLASFRLLWPAGSFRDDPSILIAGCGTSQAAKYALRWPNARVVGIDVSGPSIERTAELKRSYRLDNLELAELAVEDAVDLGCEFDYIVCTGVLHHLADPAAGLCALRNVLAPRGALQLMVYAPYGRAGIYLLQDYCRRLGIGASSTEIEDLAAVLHVLPDSHPLVRLLRGTPDFASEAGIADALLHPLDRPYSVPDLFRLLHGNGIQFGRWLRQAPYLPECGAAARTPHRRLLAQLPAAERYAAMELFRGSMLRHSAIVYRDDFPGSPQPVRFDGDEWLGYAPIRLCDTVCIEERLPPGAAGVLINRLHTYTDIYLPIDGPQKRWLNAIDGTCCIGDLLEERSDVVSARAFFEQLWQHDQIVFDASAG